MARRATGQDVADLAGVSRSAVSLVLNGRGAGNISAEKQAAIIDAASRLNYTPDAVALSLRSRRTRTLGALTWPGDHGFPESILSATLAAATDARYVVLMADARRDHDGGVRALATLRDRQVDALLVVAPEMDEVELPEPPDAVPTILVNCVDRMGELTSLVPDEGGAGATAARLLRAAGHRSIGLVAGRSASFLSKLRAAGVRRVMSGGRAGVLLEVEAGNDIADGFAAARDLLSRPDRPTALICVHERLAVGAALAAGDLGLAVPSDLSMVSLEDGAGLSRQLVPALTTIGRPDQAMAEKAVTMLIGQLGTPDPAPTRQLTFRCAAVPGASVARVPTSDPAVRVPT
jgi:LacI family transcriptional regulator